MSQEQIDAISKTQARDALQQAFDTQLRKYKDTYGDKPNKVVVQRTSRRREHKKTKVKERTIVRPKLPRELDGPEFDFLYQW